MDDRDLDPMAGGEADQDELWLISYADLVTLLVGFFVLLIAAAPPRPARFEAMAASISGSQPPPLEALKERVDALMVKKGLQDRVVARQDADGLGIELKDTLLFGSGSAELHTDGLAVLDEVAGLLRELPERQIIVEGHTDDVPIRTAQFASNWELSARRAITVRGALEQAGIPRGRMAVQGYADTRPRKVAGTLDEQRAANRRVVIRVE